MIIFYKVLVVIDPPMGFCFQAVLVHGDHQCNVLARSLVTAGGSVSLQLCPWSLKHP